MSIINTATTPKNPNNEEDAAPFVPKPKKPVEYPKTVSAEELRRLQELDTRHKRGDFRQGNY